MATISPVSTTFASKTTPKDPFPIIRSAEYDIFCSPSAPLPPLGSLAPIVAEGRDSAPAGASVSLLLLLLLLVLVDACCMAADSDIANLVVQLLSAV